MFLLLSIQEGLGFFVFKRKVACKSYHFILYCQKFVFLLRLLSFRTFRDQLAELSFCDQILNNVQSSNKLTFHIKLRICRPVFVGSEPVSHELIFNDIVKGKFDLMVLENLEQRSSESAFWIFWSPFNKNDNRAAWKNGFNFREPNFLIHIILFSVLLYLSWQLIKNQAQIFRLLVSLQNFFISLCDYHCGSSFNIKLSKGFWAFSSL